MNANVHPLEPIPHAPPHNSEIEAALLGALLTNAGTYDRVADILLSEHFYEPVHGRIFDAIGKTIDRGQKASPQALAHFFDADAGLAEVGGSRYLYELAAGVISVVNTDHYARIVIDLYRRRRIVEICNSGLLLAGEPSMDADGTSLAEDLAEELDGLQDREKDDTTHNLAESAMVAAEAIEAACESGRGMTGISTGLADMDRLTAGFQAGDLLLLAGRPSMGKTALAGNIMVNVARTPDPDTGAAQPVLFFSVEMSHDQVTKRFIAAESGISFDRMRKGHLSPEERGAVAEAAASLGKYPLVIDDAPAITVAKMRARARRFKRARGLSLIVVDYLQILDASSDARKYGNKVQEISEMTRKLKALAKELQVPVLCLSQLSRQVESREDKRPQLADLRESGAIEQDADVVMFIYRDYYYAQRAEPNRGSFKSDGLFNEAFDRWAARCSAGKNLVEIGLAKQRQGPAGTVKLFADLEVMRFGNLDDRQAGFEL